MLERYIAKRIVLEEQRLGVPLDHMRYLADHARPVLVRLFVALALLHLRRTLPEAVYAVARLVATRSEDCGSCVQIEVNLARQENVEPVVLRAVLDDRPDALPPDLADVYGFARAVCAGHGGDEAVRERIRARFGHRGLIELAIHIAHFFPVMKRALGYAQSCSLVRLPADGDVETRLVSPLAGKTDANEKTHAYG